MKRDKTLDTLRGFAIIQVVFVHLLYWTGIFATGNISIYKSFFLFEMPLFFFVTGAVNAMGEIHSYKKFCLKRIKGLLIPYYIYSLLCVIIAFVYYYSTQKLTLQLVVRTLITWLIPVCSPTMPVSYFTWALWFVPVYIIIVFLFPLIKLLTHKLKYKVFIIEIPLFLLTQFVCNQILTTYGTEGAFALINSGLDLLQKAVFYIIFVSLGALYPDLKRRNRVKVAVSAAIVIICFFTLLGLSLSGVILDMQKHKFPPNYVFLIFSSFVMSLLYLCAPLLKKTYKRIISGFSVVDKLVNYFSINSIYVFLYQSFAFALSVPLINKLPFSFNDGVLFVLYFFTVYPLVILSVFAINFIKSKIFKR